MDQILLIEVGELNTKVVEFQPHVDQKDLNIVFGKLADMVDQDVALAALMAGDI